jgi:hypothetical protein
MEVDGPGKIEDDRFILKALIPPNATVHVPCSDDVTEGGKLVDEADGVEFVRAGEGETVLAVGSGRYEFEGRMARG